MAIRALITTDDSPQFKVTLPWAVVEGRLPSRPNEISGLKIDHLFGKVALFHQIVPRVSSGSIEMARMFALGIWLVFACSSLAVAQNPVAVKREEKVRGDKAKVEADGFWIYNDLKRGFDEAKKTGRPIIVVLRCIPCEQCVKLDDDLVDKDERLRP